MYPALASGAIYDRLCSLRHVSVAVMYPALASGVNPFDSAQITQRVALPCIPGQKAGTIQQCGNVPRIGYVAAMYPALSHEVLRPCVDVLVHNHPCYVRAV